MERLERQITESAAFLSAFTPQQALWREAPGEWNILEIVGHLADTERVFGYRALRIARADPVMWTAVEFEHYAAAANFQERPLGDVVAEFTAVRAAFIAFLRGLDAAAWQRRGPHEWTTRSVRGIAFDFADRQGCARAARHHGRGHRRPVEAVGF